MLLLHGIIILHSNYIKSIFLRIAVYTPRLLPSLFRLFVATLRTPHTDRNQINSNFARVLRRWVFSECLPSLRSVCAFSVNRRLRSRITTSLQAYTRLHKRSAICLQILKTRLIFLVSTLQSLANTIKCVVRVVNLHAHALPIVKPASTLRRPIQNLAVQLNGKALASPRTCAQSSRYSEFVDRLKPRLSPSFCDDEASSDAPDLLRRCHYLYSWGRSFWGLFNRLYCGGGYSMRRCNSFVVRLRDDYTTREFCKGSRQDDDLYVEVASI